MMHATQVDYMNAKTEHAIVLAAYNEGSERAYVALEAGWISEAQFDAWIETLHGPLFAAMDVLTEAENAMIDWSLDAVAPQANFAEAREALDVLARNRHKPAIRRKLAELAFRLDADLSRTSKRSRRAA